MRLRTFTAPSITEAMRQVRETLGEDAIILSTEQQGRSVTLTAAIDPAHVGAAPIRPRNGVRVDPADAIGAALHYYGVPIDLAQHLLAMTTGLTVGDAQQALT